MAQSRHQKRHKHGTTSTGDVNSRTAKACGRHRNVEQRHKYTNKAGARFHGRHLRTSMSVFLASGMRSPSRSGPQESESALPGYLTRGRDAAPDRGSAPESGIMDFFHVAKFIVFFL